MKKRKEIKKNDYDVTFKIVIMGDSSVPKTSVILRYISGRYMEDFKLTLGIDYCSKSIEINGKKIKLQIWDFGGEERFRFLLAQYIKGTNCAAYLYDISNRATLIHLHDWIQIVRENTKNVSIVLAGVSVDPEEGQIITSDEGLEAVKKYNLDGFIEVNPKTGKNINELFDMITNLALKTSPNPRRKGEKN